MNTLQITLVLLIMIVHSGPLYSTNPISIQATTKYSKTSESHLIANKSSTLFINARQWIQKRYKKFLESDKAKLAREIAIASIILGSLSLASFLPLLEPFLTISALLLILGFILAVTSLFMTRNEKRTYKRSRLLALIGLGLSVLTLIGIGIIFIIILIDSFR